MKISLDGQHLKQARNERSVLDLSTGLRRAGFAAACSLALAIVGCSGSTDVPSDGEGMAGADTSTGGQSTDGTGGTGGVAIDPPEPGADVNRVGIHRLNKSEYDLTMKDLLGVAETPAKTFIGEEKLFGFDNIAEAFGMTDAQFEQYYTAADGLVEGVFADPTLRGRIMTCTPTAATDTVCMDQIIRAFGMRAWRRPLTDAEVTRLIQLASDAIALGEDTTGGVKQVVKTLLSSVPFLYRVEMDANPESTEPHALNGYELASRLSYLGWSTMPDDELFTLAGNGELLKTEVLSAQVDRMLASPKADAFVENFAGQCLGLRDLMGHQVEPTVFSDWNEQLRQSMVQEGMLYFREFLTGDLPMTQFFTADINFVDDTLAQHYGMPGGGGATPTRVSNTSDDRVGFMGLASFLTFSSFSYRTAPTLRGKWVLENLLCQTIAIPPPNVPKLDDESAPPEQLQSENVRIRLEAHRADENCAVCHRILDPIGIGLENYDAIGRYRTQYPNGDAVDPAGEIKVGGEVQQFSSLTQLANLLASDTRLTDCASKKLMTYALSREIGASDLPYLKQIRENWAKEGMGLRPLLKQIVLNDTFRFRRGEGAVSQ